MASYYCAYTVKFHPKDVLDWNMLERTLYEELKMRAESKGPPELFDVAELKLEVEFKGGYYYVYFMAPDLG